MCEFLFSFFFYSGSKCLNIFYQYDGNFVKKLSTFCTPVREKISYYTKTHKGLSIK